MRVQWKAVPAQCQWTNVGARRAIQIAKRTLKKTLEANNTLDFQVLQATLHRVTEILKQWPFVAKMLVGNQFEAVTTAMLLLGCTAASRQ